MKKEEEIQAEQEQKLETKETEDGGVEVSLDDEVTPQEEVPEEKEEEQKEDEKEKPKQDSFTNKLYAQQRIIDRQQRELEAIRQRELLAQRTSPKEDTSVPTDEVDKLAKEGNWKEAVKILAKQEAQALLRIEQERMKREQELIQIRTEQEQNAQVVAQRHPELNDETSEKALIFKEILAKHPNWVHSPDGPKLAMYEMEDELRSRGYDIDGVGKKVEAEKERIARVHATSLPSSRKTIPTNKVVLTKEMRDFCDTNEIPYEVYARTLKSGGGIEL